MSHNAMFIQAIRRSRVYSSLHLLILAGLLLTAPTSAQVTYTGTAANQNFGPQAIGSPSVASTFSFSIAAETTVGSIAVVTQGAPNLDFTEATGSTCAAQTYASAATCTVNVTFKPRAAGARYGAVVFRDGSGSPLASEYLTGTGSGPQLTFLPGTETTIEGSVSSPNQIAVDASGTIYIAAWGDGLVLKETPAGGSYTQTTIGSGLTETTGVAVDGAGNVYILCWGRSQVTKETWTGSGYVESLIGSGMVHANEIAVDGRGNLYIVDSSNNRILMETLSAGSYTQSEVILVGSASGVAVDGSGNIYVVAYGGGSILMLTPSPGGYTQSRIGSGLGYTSSIAVDGHGNLYTAATLDNQIVKETLTPSGYVQSTIASSGLDWPWGVGVDQLGNVYINDTYHSRVLKENYSDAPSLSFASTAVGSASSDSPQTVTLTNSGNATLDFPAPSSGNNPSIDANFTLDSNGASACPLVGSGASSAGTLAPGANCLLPISFTPDTTGELSGALVLTDNALNVIGAQQSIGVSGTVIGIATHFSVTGPSNAGANVSFTITVTALNASGTTATGYTGTVSFTSTDGTAVLPAASKLTDGIGTFRVTLKTLGNQTVTATDAANSLTGTSAAIDVSTAPPGVFPVQSSVNLGSQAIGSPSTAQTLSFTIGAGTTVGSIGVLTQGAPNLDFTAATGSTCAAQTYASAATCTVNVIFTPKSVGLRMGAVVFFSEASNTGTVLGQARLYGTGTGPQIAFSPAPAIAIDPYVNGIPLNYPYNVAVDAAGDLFIADWEHMRVIKVPPGGGAPTAIDPIVNGMALDSGSDVAVDGAGDLFITDYYNNRIVEVPTGGGAATAIDPTVNGKGLNGPNTLALDQAGDLFIVDYVNNRVVEVPAGGGAAIAIEPVVNGNGLRYLEGAAVNAAGDLFIADAGNNRVVEVPAGGGTAFAIAPQVNGKGLSAPGGLAVDGVGNLFITDNGNNRIVEVPAGGRPATAIVPIVNGESLQYPNGVAVDGSGNLFIADGRHNRVVEIQSSQPPTLNFPTATPVGTTDTADGTQTVQIQNIGNEALTLTALSYPADFPETTGDPNACTSSTSLTPGLHCDVPIEFTPQSAGPLSETISLTDNALNVTGPQQSIALTGTAFVPPTVTHFSVTTTTPVVAGKPFSVTVSALTSSNQVVTSFTATVSFTSSDPSFANPGPLTLSSGTAQTAVTLNSQGTQSITVTDASNPALTGSANFLVNPPPPPLAFSATTLSFGSEALRYSTPGQAVTLTNNTSSAIAIASIKLTGADATSFVTSNTCGTSLAAAATCRIGARFVPAALGPASAAVTVTDSAPNSPQSIALSGTGISAPTASLSLSATSLLFGTEFGDQSTAAQSVTVTNSSSSATVYFNSITLSGANASSFVTSNTCGGIVGGILAPAATCKIGVRFVPRAGGPLSATITLADNAAASPQTIALSGTGIGPLVTLSATSIPFGDEPLGDSTNAQAVTLSNTGYLPLEIASIRLAGANVSSFATSNTCGLSLPAGASCKIGVRFIPGVQGPAGAAITLTDNAPDSPQTIALSGTGIAPPPASLSLSTTSLTFGNETVGTSTAAQNVTVTNTSATATLYFKTITLGGTNPSSFVTSNSCNGPSGNGLGGSLAPGAQCRIGARFAPKTAGPLTATITLTDSAADSPQTITLTGTGQ